MEAVQWPILTLKATQLLTRSKEASFQVVPRFEHGQPKLEEILDTMRGGV